MPLYHYTVCRHHGYACVYGTLHVWRTRSTSIEKLTQELLKSIGDETLEPKGSGETLDPLTIEDPEFDVMVIAYRCPGTGCAACWLQDHNDGRFLEETP